METLSGLTVIVAFIILLLIAVIFLKGFDKVAGRGSKQVSDGIRQVRGTGDHDRIPCPMCAEKILPQAKICPFCKSSIKNLDIPKTKT